MSHNKTKLTVKLDPGQACVVADLEMFNHIRYVYNELASSGSTQEEKDSWLDVVNIITHWVNQSYVPIPGSDDEPV